MVFGRKKKEAIETTTSVMDAPVSEKQVEMRVPEAPKAELTAEQKILVANAEYYVKNYGFFYGSGDVAQNPEITTRAEQINLMFAMFCELKQIKESLLRMEAKEGE